MSSFQPISIAKANVAGENKPFVSARRDLVIFVTDINTERNYISGYTSDNKFVQAHVAPAEIAKQRAYYSKTPESADKADRASYLGHEINAKMKALLSVNGEFDGKHLAILHGASTQRKIVKTTVTPRGTESEFRIVECSRITDGGTDPTKTFEALITVNKNARSNRVDRFQVWNPNAFSANDTASLQALAKDYDDFIKSSEANKTNAQGSSANTFYLPATGSELRVIRMSDNPVEGGVIVDLSGRLERSSASVDENTGASIPSAPCSGELFLKNVEAYLGYVKEKYGDNVKVEVAHYQSYPAGARNNEFDFSMARTSFSPLIQMAHAQSLGSEDDTKFIEGGNYGGWGVLSISKDEHVEGSNAVIQKNFVNSMAMSNISRSFIHKKIAATDGQRYDLKDTLKGKVLRYNAASNEQANTNPRGFQPSSQPSQSNQPYPSGSAQSAPSFDDERDIPFDHLPTSRSSPRP